LATHKEVIQEVIVEAKKHEDIPTRHEVQEDFKSGLTHMLIEVIY
jgi:hypothetical protein